MDANAELLAATDCGDIARASAAVEAGASLTAALTAGGSNALQNAAFEGHTGLCLALIELGAPVDARRQDGVNALEIAARNGHTETVQALATAAAKANLKSTADSDDSYTRSPPPAPEGLMQPEQPTTETSVPVIDWSRTETDRDGFLKEEEIIEMG